MIGTNVLQLNEATMKEALQDYLDKMMTRYSPTVKSIKQNHSNSIFEVTIIEKEEEEEEE